MGEIAAAGFLLQDTAAVGCERGAATAGVTRHPEGCKAPRGRHSVEQVVDDRNVIGEDVASAATPSMIKADGVPGRAKPSPLIPQSRRRQRRVDVDLPRRRVALCSLHQLLAEFGLAREDELLQVGERVVV